MGGKIATWKNGPPNPAPHDNNQRRRPTDQWPRELDICLNLVSIVLFNTSFHLYLLLCGEDQAAVTVPTEIIGAGLISNQPAERVKVLFPSLRHGEEK